jgi:hypothetical protein
LTHLLGIWESEGLWEMSLHARRSSNVDRGIPGDQLPGSLQVRFALGIAKGLSSTKQII